MKRRSRRTPEEKKLSYTLAERKIQLTLRKSQRARRVRLEISARRGVVLVVPRGVSQTVALGFLKEKEPWLRGRLERLEARVGSLEREFGDPPQLLYLGKKLPVEIERRPQIPRPRVQREEDKLVLVWPSREKPGLDVLVQTFETFYRGEAVHLFAEMQKQTAGQMRLSMGPPTIRGQKTLWGSYSPAGRVSLNWKLMMAPLEAIRYVIVHELSHALVRNHSPRFWRQVAQFCPQYKLWRRWLHEHGDLIQRLATFEHLTGLTGSEELPKRGSSLWRA